MVRLIDAIVDGLVGDKMILAILCDLTMCTRTSTPELEHYGLRNDGLGFLQSYLNNHWQFASVGKQTPSLLLNNIGIPQWSILGPVFFLVYVNDLPSAYADNLILLIADHYSDFARTLDFATTNCKDFFLANQRKLIEAKTSSIILSSDKWI